MIHDLANAKLALTAILGDPRHATNVMSNKLEALHGPQKLLTWPLFASLGATMTSNSSEITD